MHLCRYFIGNGSREFLVCRWQSRVRPITSRVLNARTAAVLYLHQTMLHLMEFCTANTTFRNFSRKKEATTTWSSLHPWSVKQQPQFPMLKMSSYELLIWGLIPLFHCLLPLLPQCVLLWSSQSHDGNERELGRASCIMLSKLFVSLLVHRTSNRPFENGQFVCLKFKKTFWNFWFWLITKIWSHSVFC